MTKICPPVVLSMTLSLSTLLACDGATAQPDEAQSPPAEDQQMFREIELACTPAIASQARSRAEICVDPDVMGPGMQDRCGRLLTGYGWVPDSGATAMSMDMQRGDAPEQQCFRRIHERVR